MRPPAAGFSIASAATDSPGDRHHANAIVGRLSRSRISRVKAASRARS